MNLEEQIEFKAVNSHTVTPIIYSDLFRPWTASALTSRQID